MPLGRAHATSDPHVGPTTADGASLYAQYCALCHGAEREGHAADHAPSLRAPEMFESAPPAFLWYAVAYGRPGTAMAAFATEQGGPLSHDEQHVLLDWLEAQSGVTGKDLPDTPVRGDVERGETVYAERCAECHGATGQGGTAPALANPVLLATASDAFLRDTIARGRTGTPMPAFRGVLDESELDAVTAFLRSRAGGWAAPAPVVVNPPDPSSAIQNAKSPVAKLPVRQGRFVAAADVAAALAAKRRIVLLDARPLSDWQRGHLPGALPVPYYEGVERIVPHLPDDETPIVVYCACPHAASGKVVDALRAAGRTRTYVLDEGSLVWAAHGYPVAIGGAR
ncbi:MAG: c-type cytochrome [Deltaproteobacteria bacterium]|nr:c-type cytochrome [Deltaproteobacteria bacterium]